MYLSCRPVAFRTILKNSILILLVYVFLWILMTMTSAILHLQPFLPSTALASSLSRVAW